MPSWPARKSCTRAGWVARAGVGRRHGRQGERAAARAAETPTPRVVRNGRRMRCPPVRAAPGVRPESQGSTASATKGHALSLESERPTVPHVLTLEPGDPDALADAVAGAFRPATDAAPSGVFAAPGPGEPDRRARRLQRRPLPAHGAAARDVRRGGRCATTRRSRSRSRQQDDSLQPARWTRRARVRRRAGRRTPAGCCGRCARTAGTCPAWTSSSTAGCRSGPDCRARRRWSARWRSRSLPSVGADVDDDLRARSGARPACAPSGTSPARPPVAWTRRSRCSRRAGVRAAARLPRLVDAAGAVGPGGGRAVAARRGHPGLALAQRRRLPVPPAGLRDGGRGSLGVDAAARRGGPGGRAGALEDATVRRRVRHVFTEIDRVRQAVAAARRPATTRPSAPVVHGVARVAARRLRGLLRRAGRRGGRRAGRTAPSAPG